MKLTYAKIIILTFTVLIFQSPQVDAQIVYNYDRLPYPSEMYQEIEYNEDKVLQRNLEKFISRNKKYTTLAAQKRLSIGIVDLRNPSKLKYASINGNHMMYAASLPKIAVLLTAMQSVQEGCLNYDRSLQKDLRLMIAKSNNAATTRVIERVGFDKIANVLQDERYNLYDRNKGGGLWVGKKYAKSGKRNPDPIKGLSHAASVDQVCRFYTLLAYNKFVNNEYNAEMMRYLIDPKINHKFVKVLKKTSPGCDLYRKSGSWRNFHSDSVLVFGENGKKYILVALIEDKGGSSICKNLAKEVENILGLKNNFDNEIIKTDKPLITSGDD